MTYLSSEMTSSNPRTCKLYLKAIFMGVGWGGGFQQNHKFTSIHVLTVKFLTLKLKTKKSI